MFVGDARYVMPLPMQFEPSGIFRPSASAATVHVARLTSPQKAWLKDTEGVWTSKAWKHPGGAQSHDPLAENGRPSATAPSSQSVAVSSGWQPWAAQSWSETFTIDAPPGGYGGDAGGGGDDGGGGGGLQTG